MLPLCLSLNVLFFFTHTHTLSLSPLCSRSHDLTYDLLCAAQSLHQHDVLCGDFRPENVMIDSYGSIMLWNLGELFQIGVQREYALLYALFHGTPALIPYANIASF